MVVLTTYCARAHRGRPCDSFNQLAKKLVTRSVASLERTPGNRSPAQNGLPLQSIPYSGKFLLVQNFAELLINPLEIFVVLIFARSLRVCTIRTCTVHNFAVLIFAAADLSAKNAKVCTMRKFPAIWYMDNLESQLLLYCRLCAATGKYVCRSRFCLAHF